MKLSIAIEGRTPGIVVPAGRTIAFRVQRDEDGGQVEVVVGDTVLVTRPGAFVVHVGPVDDNTESDGRVQHALGDEALFGTEVDELRSEADTLREENITLRAQLEAHASAATAATEGPSGLLARPDVRLVTDRRVDLAARAEDDRASEFIRLTTEGGLSDAEAQAIVWPEEFGNQAAPTDAEGAES